MRQIGSTVTSLFLGIANYTVWRKYENSIFEAVKIKLNQ